MLKVPILKSISRKWTRLSCIRTNCWNSTDPTKKNGKCDAVKTVQDLLKTTRRNAWSIVNENGKLATRSTDFLKRNYEQLVANNVDTCKVSKYPLLLGVAYLDEALVDLKNLPYPLDTTIVLACLVRPKLDRFIATFDPHDHDKIETISKLLTVPHDEACEIIYKRDFLVAMHCRKLTETIQILNDAGISVEDIKRDIWVMRYSQDTIRSRLEIIQQYHISTVKTWMIRSPPHIIESYVKRREDKREILGNDSLIEYLSKRLECSEDQTKYLISKMPALLTKSLPTLSDIINFLYERGFKPSHIYRVPKILVHSVETTKKRLERLEKAGLHIDSLYMLIKSQKQFNQYFEAQIKAKKPVM